MADMASVPPNLVTSTSGEGSWREKRDINTFNSLVMQCFEKVERKQGDWVKFRLFVKLMQESN